MIAPAIDAVQPVQFKTEPRLRQESIKEDILHIYENHGGKMTCRALAKYVLNKLNVSISHHTVSRLIERYKKTGGDIRACVADGRATNAPREKAKEYEQVAMDLVHSYVFTGEFYKKAHQLMVTEAPKLGIHHTPTLSQVYNFNRHIPKGHRPEILRNAKAAVDVMRSNYPKQTYRVNEKWCVDETSFIVKDFVSDKEHVVMLSLTFDVETGFLRPFHYKVTDKFDRNADSTTRIKTGWTSADTIQALFKSMDKDPDILVRQREKPEGYYWDRHASHLSDAVRFLVRKLDGPTGKPIRIDYSVGEDPRTNGLAERSIGYFKYQFLRGFLKRREEIAKNSKGPTWVTSLSFLPKLLKEAAREYNSMKKTGRSMPRVEDYMTASSRVNARVDWKQVDHCCRDFLKGIVFSNKDGIRLAPGFTYKNAGMYVWDKMDVWVAYRPGRYNSDIDIYEPGGACKEPRLLGTLKHIEADNGQLKARDRKVAYRDAKALHDQLTQISTQVAELSIKITPAPADGDLEVVNYGVAEGVVDIPTDMPPQEPAESSAPDSEADNDATKNSSSPSNVIPFKPQQTEEETQPSPTTTRIRRQYRTAKI